LEKRKEYKRKADIIWENICNKVLEEIASVIIFAIVIHE
jgi:hypothetical protein